MSWQRVDTLSIAPQAWRNGGGQTRELMSWPSAANWQVRVSIATIDRDGAFSCSAGVQRWFAVLSGPGVRLAWPGPHMRERVLHPGDPAEAFDGADAPVAHLLGGSTQDLNLMIRFAARAYLPGTPKQAQDGAMRLVTPPEAWLASPGWQAIYAPVAGGLSSNADALPSQTVKETVDVPAHTLLWRFCATAEHLQWQSSGPMWWMEAQGLDTFDKAVVT
jgi:uncharacterized protein